MADAFMRQGLQFFISIILARLLSPEDFGLIAIITVFTSLAGLFIDSGFGSALIQKQDTTITDEATVFFFNVGVGALSAIALCLAAPWISGFFEQPALQALTYVMALNLFITSFGSIHRAMLTKKMDFKTSAKITAVSTFLSGLLAILLAWNGVGVWSLAWQILLSTLLTVLMLWVVSPWRPRLIFSLDSLKRLYGFGGYLMLTDLLEVLDTRLQFVLIGKLYAASDLGFYARAQTTRQMPIGMLEGVMSRVAFPVFSEVSIDKDRLVRGIKKATLMMMLINIPIMMGLAVVAEPFVIVLFGERWLPTVPFLQVLCLGGILWPLHVVNLNVLMALGRSDIYFRIGIVKKIISISAVIYASQFGIIAMAWSQVAVGVIAFFINTYYIGTLLGYGARRQTVDLLPYYGAGLIMAACTWFVGQAVHWPSAVELICLTGIGMSVYLLMSWVLKLSALADLLQIFRIHKV